MAQTKIPANLLDTSAHVDLLDNEQIRLGSSQDLQIYHDGGNSYIKETGAGALVLQSAGPAIVLEKTDGANMLLANTGGAVTLYHNGNPKLETSATGASVTGNLAVSGNLTVSGTTTELDTTNLNVTDKNITLNYHASNDTSSNADGAGITIQDAVSGSADATISWVASSDEFAFSHPASIVNTVGGDTVLNLTGTYGSGNNVALLGFARSGGAVAGDIRYTDATTDMEIGTSTAHGFSLKTTNTKRLTVASGGYVGIGTTTPSSQFVVAASNGGKGIETQVTTHATNNQFILAYDRANSAYLNMELSALNFGIATNNGTNRFKILANGNVGIGTAVPSTPVHVVKVGNPNGGNRNTVEDVLTLEATGYYPYTGYGVGINFQGEDYGNTAIRDYGKIQAVMEGNSAQTAAGDAGFTSQLAFWTNSGGASNTVSTQKMTIKADGKVGIGTPSPSAKLSIFDEDAGQPMLQVRNYSAAATGSFGNAHSVELRSATSTTTHGVLIQHYENNIARRSLDVADSNGIFASFVQGKVGIGTTSPASHLEVFNATAPVISLGYNGGTNNGGSIDWNLNVVGTPLTAQIAAKDDGNYRMNMIFSTKTSASGSSGMTERMRIDPSGRVMIGTTTEGRAGEGADMLTIGATSNNSGMTMRSGTSGYGSIYFSDGTSGTDEYKGYLQYGHATDVLHIAAGGSTVMNLKGGKVAIGGNFTPSNQLEIQGGGYDQLRIGSNHTDNTNKTAGIVSTTYTNQSVSLFQMFNQNGSNSVYYGSADGAHRGLQNHYFYVNTNYNSTSGHKLAYNIKASGGGGHEWHTQSNSNAKKLALHNGEGLWLYNNGGSGYSSYGTGAALRVTELSHNQSSVHYIEIGGNLPGYTAGQYNCLKTDLGDLHFAAGGTYTGYISSGGTFTDISDVREKENIVTITNATAKLKQLRGVYHTWKDTENRGTDTTIGLIAQEVEAVVPEVVTTSNPTSLNTPASDTAGLKGVAYAKLVPLLIETIKELEARITTLEG